MSTITVSLVQPDLAWEDKAANLQLLGEKIDAIQERTEIIILPEMFNTGFSMRPEVLAEKMDGPTISWMREKSMSKRAIITGSLIIEEEGNYFNRAIWMLPNGQFGTYDKRHLFAFGQEDKYFAPGSRRLITSVKGWRIQPLVCYDLRFPVWARQHSQETGPEYEVLIYMANWPSARVHAWKTLLQARAIENQCYVIGVNRVGKDGKGIDHSGDSMVIGPLGEIIFHATSEEVTHTVTLERKAIDKVREKFPFWKDADSFHISHD